MGQVLFAPALAGCTSDDVTASAAQVLSGYTALTKDSNDDPISGTMTNRGAWTSSSSGSGTIAIPAGYHNGSGYVDCSGAYNAGVTAADARANTSSANYKAGYNAGVTAADARANTSSANYKAGYNAGKSVTVAKLSGIKISANRAVAPKGDGAQGAAATGTFTIDTSNYSSAWLGSCEISRTKSYDEATMKIQSNGGSVLFSLSTSGEGKKTGGNVRLNLSGVNSITIYIRPAIYDNAFNRSDSYGYIDSLTFAA